MSDLRKSIEEFKTFLKSAEIPMHGVMISKDSRTLYEAYAPGFNKDTLHRMYSITKSFVAIAISFLVDEGKINLDDHIVDYFPEKVPENCHEYIKAITIRNMLTMRTAHTKTTYKLSNDTDYVRTFFTVEPNHYPGTFFAYDTSSTHVLCALVEKLTGKELLAYMREKMLDDIGFSKEAYTLKDPMGITMGGSGLMAKTSDILKFMTVIMNDGMYGGKQYINRGFLKEALAKQADNYAIMSTIEEMSGYGYQFWMTRLGGYVCYGMGGQLGLVIPDKKIILATTADTQGRQGGVELIYDAFYSTVYKALAEGADTLDIIEDSLWSVQVNNISNDDIKSLINQINGCDIILNENEGKFKSIKICLEKESGSITYENASGIHTLMFGIGANIETRFPYYNHRALVSGGFVNNNTLLVYAQIVDEYVGKVFFNISFNGDNVGVYVKKIEESYYKEFNFITGGKIRRD